MSGRNVIKLYLARPGHLFDPGTEADLVEDYRGTGKQEGLFLGLRNGKWVEAVCDFKEFVVKVVPEQDARSIGGTHGEYN
jgi:hypothetical protein